MSTGSGIISGSIAAIGERALLEGFLLAGVLLFAASTDEEILRAWAGLPQDTADVILTPRSSHVLETVMIDPSSPMTVVFPA